MNAPTGFDVESAERLDLFPTPIWWADLAPEAYRPLNALIKRKLVDLFGGELTLDRGCGYQTDQDLHEHPDLAPLAEIVRGAVGGVLGYLGVEAHVPAITGCWANVSAPGSSHLRHTHPNNFLSGVYYVQTGPGADTISFDDPRAQPMVVHVPPEEENRYHIARAHMTVSEGSLLIFPAWFEHLVAPNQSNDLRISVSFNAMLRAPAPDLEPPGPRSTIRVRD